MRNRLCDECEGKGTSDLNNNSIVVPKMETDPNLPNKCTRCYGRGVFPDEKQFTFSIQGYSHNDRIVFKNEADQMVYIYILSSYTFPYIGLEGSVFRFLDF